MYMYTLLGTVTVVDYNGMVCLNTGRTATAKCVSASRPVYIKIMIFIILN